MLSFGDCSDDWEWATAFCNLPGTLFCLIADDDADYDFNNDDDDFDKRNQDDFCNLPGTLFSLIADDDGDYDLNDAGDNFDKKKL